MRVCVWVCVWGGLDVEAYVCVRVAPAQAIIARGKGCVVTVCVTEYDRAWGGEGAAGVRFWRMLHV